MGSTLMAHWEISLVAGVVLGVHVLAALYLAPLARLRLAADEEDRARMLRGELDRLRRLHDAAAVLEEHGRSSEARELRSEAEFQAFLLVRASRISSKPLDGRGRVIGQNWPPGHGV